MFLNGACIGRGPCQSDPFRYHSFDTRDVTGALRPGRNAIAVVCHNYGIGLHWHHRGPGGLIAQLDVESPGGAIAVATGDQWRVCHADCYAPNSPRMFWSAGFMETFLGDSMDDGWVRPEFDDHRWERPDVEPLDLATARGTLVARDIPLLHAIDQRPVTCERGTFTLRGPHAVAFDGVLALGDAGLVYAHTYLLAPEDMRLTLHLECDDACKVFVNDVLLVEQGYDESFARTRVWRGLDDYEQVHDGLGPSGFMAPVTLKAGWNSLFVAVDCGPRQWGFALAFQDSDGNAREFRCAPDRRGEAAWRITGPFASTGLADSLDGRLKPCASLGRTRG